MLPKRLHKKFSLRDRMCHTLYSSADHKLFHSTQFSYKVSSPLFIYPLGFAPVELYHLNYKKVELEHLSWLSRMDILVSDPS